MGSAGGSVAEKMITNKPLQESWYDVKYVEIGVKQQKSNEETRNKNDYKL